MRINTRNLVCGGTLFILLFITGCAKDNAPTEIAEDGSKRVTDMQDYLSEVGMFDKRETRDFKVERINSTANSSPVVLSYPFVNIEDNYQQHLIEEQATAVVPRSTNIPTVTDTNIWPGNLIQGNSLNDPNLSSVPLSKYRTPGTIYLNVVSGQEGMSYSREVEELSGSQVTQAMNDIMSEHTNGLPAYVNYSQHTVRSQQEMAYYLDMNESELTAQTNNTFASINWQKLDKTYIMVKLEQIYFTIGYDPQTLEDTFTEDMNVDILKEYTYEGNPLCYISSVSYGRYLILLYEVDSRAQGFNNTLDKVFNKDRSEPLNDAENMIYEEYTNIKMVQIGGNAGDGLNLIADPTPENLRNFIINGSNFDKDNVGAPIYYNVSYLHNNQSAMKYKELDTTYRNYEYSLADNDNEVELTIQSIQSNRLVLTGGNYHLNSASSFTVSDIKVSVTDDYGNWVTVGSIPSGISRVQTINYATNRSYYQTVNLGKFGHDTKKNIKLHFTVAYRNVRGKSNGSIKDDQTRSFPEAVVFEYDTQSRKWVVAYNDKSRYGTNVDFQTIHVSDNFNFCNVGFYLKYSFKANYKQY